jgi:hypothetical protein
MHRTPTSNADDPTVVHEITEQLSPTPAADEAATTADPTPAGVPDAWDVSEPSAAPDGAGSDAAGSGRPPRRRDDKGRFLVRPRIPAMSAELAQALLDASAEAWRTDNALRYAAVRVAAVEFVDRVRHADDGDGAA